MNDPKNKTSTTITADAYPGPISPTHHKGLRWKNLLSTILTVILFFFILIFTEWCALNPAQIPELNSPWLF
ncbi:uncharacterized protein ASPGLDRAFT_45932 [Aspergillus glaucus CBS 516.65]|uniref:Uncharacterized protein n=1 Tax=Aspergillus glaucus CBS 516.65 TaxID=1160497 RepID=A0A1L9VM27_ASPGL|nr:hypothetical protein ASPGLDRAFT_45932 [Aspergillus glaucus CBS 516.65]OJJ84973.1 hypothetical protein ASPGLDRAFT_45932 [Aspergillus glaucus CBS 516.65]